MVAAVAVPPSGRMTGSALLLALTNGLTSAVLGGMHDPDTAVALLGHQLDRLFTSPDPPGGA